MEFQVVRKIRPPSKEEMAAGLTKLFDHFARNYSKLGLEGVGLSPLRSSLFEIHLVVYPEKGSRKYYSFIVASSNPYALDDKQYFFRGEFNKGGIRLDEKTYDGKTWRYPFSNLGAQVIQTAVASPIVNITSVYSPEKIIKVPGASFVHADRFTITVRNDFLNESLTLHIVPVRFPSR